MAVGRAAVKSYKRTNAKGTVIDVEAHTRTEDFADAVSKIPGRPGIAAKSGAFPKGRSIPGVEAPSSAMDRLKGKANPNSSESNSAVDALAKKVKAPKAAPAPKEIGKAKGQEPDSKSKSQAETGAALKKAAAPAKRAESPRSEKRAEKVDKAAEAERSNPRNPEHWQTKFTRQEADAYRLELTQKLNRHIQANGDTARQFGKKDANGDVLKGVYVPERQALHDEIISEILEAHKDVPREKQAVMSGGLGGAGKGFVLGGVAGIDQSQYLTLDPDEIKQAMIEKGMEPKIDGVDPGETAWAIHEESSDISSRLKAQAQALGMNIILDNTMGSDKVFGKIQELKDLGYEVDGVFVDVPIQQSIDAAFKRHMNGKVRRMNGTGFGGRFVPEFLQGESGPKNDKSLNSRNRERFDEIADMFRHSRVYDNSVHGRDPQLVSEQGTPAGKKPQDDPSKTTERAFSELKLTRVNDETTLILQRLAAEER